MSQSHLDYETPDMMAPGPSAFALPSQRSLLQPLLMTIPVALCGVSFLGGGWPMVTDLGFIVLTILCAIFLVTDLLCFSERFGIGGIVLYGGIIIWICHDYLVHWSFKWLSSWQGPETPYVVAKASAAYMVYFLFLSIGVRIRSGKWIVNRIINKIPEPNDPSAYFLILLLVEVIGISPFFVFTSEPFYLAIYHAMTSGRGGTGTAWSVGRTGNVNYSMGAYVAQMLQVGSGGASLAAFCIIFLNQSAFKNIVCGAIFVFWLAIAFGGGTRGEVVFLLLPAACFMFIRYHVEAQEQLKKFSIKAYVIAGLIFFFTLVIVQTQIAFRTSGYTGMDMNQVSLTDIQGNSMFSEGLMGFAQIPERHPYFFDAYPGETMIMPIPDFLWWAVVSPMPRAIWTSKPIDPVWAWYNDIMTGGSGAGAGKTEGTTISTGIAGYWFIRFGIPGLIEGGLLVGWILSIAEMAMLNNRGRPMSVFAALGLATWIFRDFRGIGFWDLDEFLVGLGGIAICTLLLRPFISAPKAVPQMAA